MHGIAYYGIFNSAHFPTNSGVLQGTMFGLLLFYLNINDNFIWIQ